MDNVDFGCPARMMDGRHFTDYRPRCDVNHTLQRALGASDSYSYRLLLQRHGEHLINADRKMVFDRMVCRPCDAKAMDPYSRMQPLRDLPGFTAPAGPRTYAPAAVDEEKLQ